MTYASDRDYYDADSHIMELPNFLREFADPHVRGKMPEISYSASAVSEDEANQLMADGGHSAAYRAELIGLGDDMIKGPKEIQALGAFDRSDRSLALDILGFKKQLVFSTLSAGVVLSTRAKTEPELQYGVTRAHNRGMQTFCADDDRLLAVCLIPLDDPEAAVAELDRCLEAGVGAVWVPHRPCGNRSPGHPDLDPFWARLAESRLPFVLHIGGVAYQLDPGWMNNGQGVSNDWLGGGENVRAKDMLGMHHGPELFIGMLVMDGVFERHRDLRGASVELGAGWVPALLERLDWTVDIWRKNDSALAALTRRPSEQLTQQFGFTPYVYEDVGRFVELTNDELYLFSSDYPHMEGGRNPIGRFQRALQGHSAATQDKFYAENFKRLLL